MYFLAEICLIPAGRKGYCLSLRMDWQGEVIRFLSSVFGEGGIPFSPYATVYMSIGQKRNGAERESQGIFII